MFYHRASSILTIKFSSYRILKTFLNSASSKADQGCCALAKTKFPDFSRFSWTKKIFSMMLLAAYRSRTQGKTKKKE